MYRTTDILLSDIHQDKSQTNSRPPSFIGSLGICMEKRFEDRCSIKKTAAYVCTLTSAMRNPKETDRKQLVDANKSRRRQALADQDQSGIRCKIARRLFQFKSGHGKLGERQMNGYTNYINML